MNRRKNIIDQRKFAQLISSIENGFISLQKARKQFKNVNNRCFVIGITGPPGVGKSSIINLLISEFRKQDKKIGVIAIDPSSVKSKGAFLGDRIRLQKHATDDGVFIRSMATRGHLGGLSAKTKDVVELFKYAGFDIIIIETIGIGQTDIDITKLVDKVIMITTPAQGDEIQLLKAGIFEFSDIFVLNKSDYSNADLVFKSLQLLSDMISNKNYKIPVIKMIATENNGIRQLINCLKRKIIHDKSSKAKRK
jgi:LAO/AO transport system kinase